MLKGFPEKKGGHDLKKNPLGYDLTGCPLEQKISEMHYLYAQGDLIAALICIMIDNPLCVLTGLEFVMTV